MRLLCLLEFLLILMLCVELEYSTVWCLRVLCLCFALCISALYGLLGRLDLTIRNDSLLDRLLFLFVRLAFVFFGMLAIVLERVENVLWHWRWCWDVWALGNVAIGTSFVGHMHGLAIGWVVLWWTGDANTTDTVGLRENAVWCVKAIVELAGFQHLRNSKINKIRVIVGTRFEWRWLRKALTFSKLLILASLSRSAPAATTTMTNITCGRYKTRNYSTCTTVVITDFSLFHLLSLTILSMIVDCFWWMDTKICT